MNFADILLPLPLDGLFTYAVLPALSDAVAPGKRVVVQFGAKKEYSGIVVRLHDNHPGEGINVKPVIDVIDPEPVVTREQLAFWKWMAGYYLCHEGDVMKAALPAGLKLASESIIGYNADYDGNATLTPREQQVAGALETEGDMSIAALEKKCGATNLVAVVRSLYDKGAIRMHEELRGNYRPRYETRAFLTREYFNEARLNEAMDKLARAPQQLALLTRYLDMSGASAALTLKNHALLRPVAKSALMHESKAGESAWAGLLKKGILAARQEEVTRLAGHKGGRMPLHSLSPAQQQAISGINTAFSTKNVCLLHGVTSCGKTEIYIHLIAEAISNGKSVLYMLPEIALTTQITQRLRLFFGNDMGVFHSKFPDSERVEIWKKQLSPNPYKLIVGVRSSLFLPMKNLGLVIIDEEHEPSYKQEEPAPRYNARDAAIMLAGMCGAKTLLGTATPSLESYANARAGKYGLVEINERFGQVCLPEIHVEDVKELRRKKMMTTPLAPQLISEIQAALNDGQQTILFQNRRGYSPFLECHACGWVPRCEHCDVSLTYHRGTNSLVCHYCGAVYRVPERCPACEGTQLDDRGFGTEKIEDTVRELFPKARVARLDLDTTRSRSAYDRILSAFRDGKTDILIGTQMVSKGLDFDRVRVVGVLDADAAMNVPDFRSYERAFQMMSQVAGRAGRRDTRGTVILQTRRPETELIAQVAANDYTGMYETQIQEREAFGYPPFCRLIYIYLRHRSQYVADCASRDMAAALLPIFGDNLLGPANPPVARIKSLFIRQIMLKVERTAPVARVRSVLQQTAAKITGQYGADVYFDVDPL